MPDQIRKICFQKNKHEMIFLYKVQMYFIFLIRLFHFQNVHTECDTKYHVYKGQPFHSCKSCHELNKQVKVFNTLNSVKFTRQMWRDGNEIVFINLPLEINWCICLLKRAFGDPEMYGPSVLTNKRDKGQMISNSS